MTVPKTLIAGDTWQWTASYADYPADTWALTYYLSRSGATPISFAADADGTDYAVTVDAATTVGYTPADYKWTARVSAGGVTITVESGDLEVKADPATSTADPRSWAEVTLAAVEAFIQGNASTAQQSISIAGRAISRWSLPELMQFRDQLRAEVRAQEAGSAAGLGRNIAVRFRRA